MPQQQPPSKTCEQYPEILLTWIENRLFFQLPPNAPEDLQHFTGRIDLLKPWEYEEYAEYKQQLREELESMSRFPLSCEGYIATEGEDEMEDLNDDFFFDDRIPCQPCYPSGASPRSE